MQDCLFSIDREKNERAFMGFTHALSAIAFAMVILAFYPDFTHKILGTNSVSVLILSFLALSGASLLPDLDNTRSTAGSALGPFLGRVISETIRMSSRAIQITIRTKRDDSNPNPHRGAFHSPLVAILLGFLTWLLVSIRGEVFLPLFGERTWGYVVAIIISWVLIHIAFSGLFNSAMKSIKKSSVMGELIAFLLSLGVTLTLFSDIPEGTSLKWLPICLAVGMIIHDVGDAFTTAGAPLLSPIPWRGKVWWNFRIPPHIKAGGAAETVLFTTTFSVIIIVSVVKIIFNLLAGAK